ncbi:LLM class flavin-dependent oxidoreductase [Pseudomonas sp. MAP12]|uniref:LLM class flavin-dependent oxidoreductase n=1 Tax=Geopseudomonas aromaticivorans TaxID=2849492 RepID=A0ABS6MU73_9GAMM|nr:LLM class flavin-dependent oxidoreductase [Pseudomonas aromaticivorans]MBV2132354.1 LLM class flavin-dependent oxidoreductase [Pseudomonas aromaticivorans]
MSKRQLSLNAFLMATGHHIAAWRHPDVPAGAEVDFKEYLRVARLAEAAKFDALFVADGVAVNLESAGSYEVAARTARASYLEPFTLLSALAAVTERIGLIGTVSTSFNEPFNLARKFASLDWISGGRVGWNQVTSNTLAEARNFNRDEHLDHALRYERADEFLDVVKGLWDSWEDDAFVRDQASGQFFDSAKLHELNHRGKHFQVKGPLNVARSPQGYPVLVQAGSSEAGKEIAARTAEAIFTAHQSLESAQAFYADVKGRLARYGRRPEELKVLPGILPIVGRTAEEAQAKYQQLQELVHPQVGLSLLSGMIGADLSGYDLDGPVPQDLPETNGGKSRQALLLDLAAREQLSIRELYLRIAGARGHWTVVGSAEQIADQIQLWFENGAADGFNVMPPWLPGGLEDFIELVVPELRRRGLFRAEYAGTTLREHFGLARPENQYALQRQQRAAS